MEENPPILKDFEKWAKAQGAKKILTYMDGEPYFVIEGVEISFRNYLGFKEMSTIENPINDSVTLSKYKATN